MSPREEEAKLAQRLAELQGAKFHGNITINVANGVAKKIRAEHCRDIEVDHG